VFGTDLQKANWQTAIVVEGVFDAIGVDGVAVMGNHVTPEQAHLIERLGKRVILCPDRDKAGKELIDEAMEYGNKHYIEQRKKKVTETVIKNQNFKRVADMQFEKEDIIKKYAREFVVNKFLLQLDLDKLLQKINIEMLKY
jgi:DNA primase